MEFPWSRRKPTYGESIFSPDMVGIKRDTPPAAPSPNSEYELAVQQYLQAVAATESDHELSEIPTMYDATATLRAREKRELLQAHERALAANNAVAAAEIMEQVHYTSLFLNELAGSGFIPLPENLSRQDLNAAIVNLAESAVTDVSRWKSNLELLRSARQKTPCTPQEIQEYLSLLTEHTQRNELYDKNETAGKIFAEEMLYCKELLEA